MLWSLAASIPWLLPTHYDPWTSFYGDWMAALILLPLLAWLALAVSKRIELTRLVLIIASVSVIPALQAAAGILAFPAEAFVFVSYVLVLALSVFLGQRVELVDRERLVDCLFGGLVFAALASVGLSLYQWLALDGLGVLVPSMEIGGMRAVANVGQSNNLSTLFSLACVGCWWAYTRNQIGVWVVLVAVAFFILGVVLTGSRTGVLQLVLLAVSLVLWRAPFFSIKKFGVVFLLSAWLAFLLSAIPFLGSVLFGVDGREMLSVGLRSRIWMMALEALRDGPFFGYGWNQVVIVHVAAAERFSGMGQAVGHAHNFILDLVLWNGVLIGGVLAAAIVLWGVRQILSVKSECHGIILSAVGVFFVHAMLELPHLYLTLLVPVGLLAGAASMYGQGQPVFSLPRYSLWLMALVLGIVLVVTFRDYRSIEANLVDRKLFAARILGVEAPISPRVFALSALQEALELLDSEPKRNMSKERLDAMRNAVVRYPTTGGLFRYARASALNSNFEEARWALQLLCNLRNATACDAALSDWRTVASSGNPEMLSVHLPRVR